MISRLWHRLTRSAWWRAWICDDDPTFELPHERAWRQQEARGELCAAGHRRRSNISRLLEGSHWPIFAKNDRAAVYVLITLASPDGERLMREAQRQQ